MPIKSAGKKVISIPVTGDDGRGLDLDASVEMLWIGTSS
jgi:hypothetical protein